MDGFSPGGWLLVRMILSCCQILNWKGSVDWICHQQKNISAHHSIIENVVSAIIIVTYANAKKVKFVSLLNTFTKWFDPLKIKSWRLLSGQDLADSLTYVPSWNLSGCNPHYTVDKFRQVLQNRWMVKYSLERNLGLGEYVWVVWKFLQRKDREQETPFPWTSKCVRLTVIAEGYKSWHCPPKVKFFFARYLKDRWLLDLCSWCHTLHVFDGSGKMLPTAH